MHRGCGQMVFSKKILGLFLVALFIVGCSSQLDRDVIVVDDNLDQNENSNGLDIVVSESTSSYSLTAENFKYDIDGQENPDLSVCLGDKVKIDLTIKDGFHDWVVDEFNAKTEQKKTGETTSVEFTADKEGTFEYYCSVGSHRAKGMKGNLIVENCLR